MTREEKSYLNSVIISRTLSMFYNCILQKLEKSLWDMHKVEWMHYWEACCQFICSQCVICKKIKNHFINDNVRKEQQT